MKVLGIVGPPDAAASELADRLGERLGQHGTTAIVIDEGEHTSGGDRGSGASVTYRIGDKNWTATGSNKSLQSVLDDLAPECDYAILQGFPEADVAQVAIGGATTGGGVISTASNADAVDLDEVIESLRTIDPYETLESLVTRIKRSENADRAGAIATFTGRVRAKDTDDDDPTEYLEFEKYESVAADRMARIEDELGDREGVQDVILHHRTGRIEYGEDIVFVVVLAGHRREAFQTVEAGINRLKEEVPIFKREVTVKDEFWVHE